MKKIHFSVSGSQLSANLFLPNKLLPTNPAILFIHGWNSRQDGYFGIATAFAEMGYVCMTFDMRGHGSSEGNLSLLTRNDFVNDVTSAFDLLSNMEGVDQPKISVVGSSFGGYLAALLSSVRSCSSLGLRVPANYPDTGLDNIPHMNRANAYYEGMVDSDHVKWKSTIHPYSEIASLRALHDFKGPVLIIESEKDELVPHEVVQGYADAVADKNMLTHIVMKGAPHGLSKDRVRKKELLDILIGWFSNR